MTMRRIVSALLLLAASSSVAADFAAGVEAYGRGDYATALREFRSLAEQGDARAQFNLELMYFRGEGFPRTTSPSRARWCAAFSTSTASLTIGGRRTRCSPRNDSRSRRAASPSRCIAGSRLSVSIGRCGESK